MVKPTVGVYLGSNLTQEPAIEDAVQYLGKGLVRAGYGLVYGGASVGLMGLLAQTVKAEGGQVIGVITKHLLDKEIAFEQADELIVVDSMYDRKRIIHERSSRFIVLPGGLGTFDELFETWCQIKLGILSKPLGVVNVNGYFNALFDFVGQCKDNGFLNDAHLSIPKWYPHINACLEDLYLETAVIA